MIPYSPSEIVRLSMVDPLLFEVELKTTPWCFPDIDSITMGEDCVPSIVILPSTPSLSPSPRRMVVPAWTTRTWLDWTRWPSSSETVPLQTVVDLGETAETADSMGAIRSSRTSVTPKRMGPAVGNQR